jgi:hypothetical protein
VCLVPHGEVCIVKAKAAVAKWERLALLVKSCSGKSSLCSHPITRVVNN